MWRGAEEIGPRYNIYIAIPGDRRELFRSETVSVRRQAAPYRGGILSFTAGRTLYIIAEAESRKLSQPLAGGLLYIIYLYYTERFAKHAHLIISFYIVVIKNLIFGIFKHTNIL